MKAIVHIGTEKTGTSTVQEFFNLNRKELAKIGVAYLRSPGPINNRKLATYCMRDEFVDDHIKQLGLLDRDARLRWKVEFRHSLEEELRGLDEKVHCVVISSEHFHSRLRVQAEVDTLREILSPFFDVIEIVGYLRRQDELAVSHYSTYLKTGKFREEIIDPKIKPENPYFDYYGLAKRWSNVFGFENVKLRAFVRESLLAGDVLKDFLAQCGIYEYEKFRFPERKNETLPSSLQAFLRIFNQAFPRYIGNKEDLLSRDLRNYIIQGLSSAGAGALGERVLPARADALAFYRQFEVGNKKLFDEFFDGKKIFSEDFSMYPPAAQMGSLSEGHLVLALQLLSSFINMKVVNGLDLKIVDASAGPGLMLRDVGFMFMNSQPEVALCLMKEAKKYRPNGAKILNAIDELERRIAEAQAP